MEDGEKRCDPSSWAMAVSIFNSSEHESLWLVSPQPTGKPHKTGIGGINPIEVDTRIVCITIIQVEYPEGCAVAMILRAWSMISWRFSAESRASRAVEAPTPWS